MTRARQRTGQEAEALVALRLREEGYEILGTNVRVGRAELDIIARKAGLLVVVEVRSRSTDAFGSPLLTVDRAKTTRIRRATAAWLRANHVGTTALRFDAAAVTFDRNGIAPPKIVYYERAF